MTEEGLIECAIAAVTMLTGGVGISLKMTWAAARKATLMQADITSIKSKLGELTTVDNETRDMLKDSAQKLNDAMARCFVEVGNLAKQSQADKFEARSFYLPVTAADGMEKRIIDRMMENFTSIKENQKDALERIKRIEDNKR